ncbi:spore cortex-lytic enzyme [Pseudalkalibacillus hwajinpoensis]|uniref:spore cortex-lytic enzyme n=1 Tax=Guptibacillus hwajinpoensis TaxID=208199 RepID=UPI001CD76770|nr:spore cortex-lytic enzyme [Pseudalkalibacillus hwajinpoensis]MCA0990806.1 spore cortex-lytic enzyme [Pseudalkalibacillus hwajinpoensis]
MRKAFNFLKIPLVIGLICAPLIMVLDDNNEAGAFSNQIIQKGATGTDVIELQARLKHIGFYTGKVDGVFGWGTYWAVRNYQYEFGMDVDGLVGPEMKAKLNKTTKYDPGQGGESPEASEVNQSKPKDSNVQAKNVPSGYSQNDIKLLANAVYGEARGEPYEGQVAVAAVILNRVQSASFPNTVSGVIFEPRAFTAVSDGQIWLTPNEKAKEAVIDAINGWDPTGEALYYFNPNTATSGWIWTRPQIKQIGKHIFCE